MALEYGGALGMLYGLRGADLSLVRVATLVWDVAHAIFESENGPASWAGRARIVIQRLICLLAVVAQVGRAELIALDVAWVARDGYRTGVSYRRIRSRVQGRMQYDTSGALAVAEMCLVDPRCVEDLPVAVRAQATRALEARRPCMLGGRERQEACAVLRMLGARRDADGLTNGGGDVFSEEEWMAILRRVDQDVV